MFKISLIERTRSAYSKHSSLSTKSWQKLAERRRQEWKFQHYCIGLREVTDFARTCPHQNSILLLCPCRKWSEKNALQWEAQNIQTANFGLETSCCFGFTPPMGVLGVCLNKDHMIEHKFFDYTKWNKAKARARCQVLNLFCLWVFKIYDGGTKHVYKSLLESRKRERIYSMIGKPKHPGWTTAHS